MRPESDRDRQRIVSVEVIACKKQSALASLKGKAHFSSGEQEG